MTAPRTFSRRGFLASLLAIPVMIGLSRAKSRADDKAPQHDEDGTIFIISKPWHFQWRWEETLRQRGYCGVSPDKFEWDRDELYRQFAWVQRVADRGHRKFIKAIVVQEKPSSFEIVRPGDWPEGPTVWSRIA